MMKEQILKRSVSYVLTLCMLFLMLPVISLDVTAVGDEDVFQLDADCQVLKFVDEEVFNAADHVARLPEEETLDSYAFLNRDAANLCQIDFEASDEQGSHKQLRSTILAYVVKKRPIIHMIYPYGETPLEQLKSMSLVLTHELAHVFKLDDQYDDDEHNPGKLDSGYYPDPFCAMQRYSRIDETQVDFYRNVLDGKISVFCNDCASLILNNMTFVPDSLDYQDIY